MDRDHEPHRAPGRLGPGRRHHPRRAGRPGGLQAHRPEDLHHLGRPRRGGEHLPSGPGPHPGRAAGREGHQPVPGHQEAGPGRRLGRRAQRSAARLHRAQAGHPRLPHLRHAVRGRPGRAGGRAEQRHRPYVRDDERGAPAGGRPGRGHRRARLPAGPGLRAGAQTGAHRLGRRGHLWPPRYPPHADPYEGQDRGRPSDLHHHRRALRPGEAGPHRGRARGGQGPPGALHPHRQGLVHRYRGRGRLPGRPGARRHGLHRGDRRGPALSRRPHRPDL